MTQEIEWIRPYEWFKNREVWSKRQLAENKRLNRFWSLLPIIKTKSNWAPSSEFVSSSIPSWQILTAHAQPLRGARDLAFCLTVPLDSMLVWASSGGSGETARMRRLAWTFAARIGDKYQIRLTRPNYYSLNSSCISLYSQNYSKNRKLDTEKKCYNYRRILTVWF